MASVTVLSRKVLIGGEVVEITEPNCRWVERQIQVTGETIEEALERLNIERRHAIQTMQICSPNTMDFYLSQPIPQ